MKMEIAYSSIAVSFAILVFTITWWRVLNWMWIKPKRLEMQLRQQGFKGNPYRLVHGDLKEMTAKIMEALAEPLPLSGDIGSRVVPFLHDAVKKHGKNVFIWQGPIPTIITMHPEQIREITQNINQYTKPPSSNPLCRLLVLGLLSLEGEKWVKHRKITMSAFHMEKLKKMLPAFHATTSEMLDKWEEIIAAKSRCDCEVDVSPYLHTLTGEGISRTAFGSDYEEGKIIFELQREQSVNYLKIVQSLYIPGWRFMPTKLNRRTKQIAKMVEDTIKNMINKRIKAMEEGEKTIDNIDLLGLLIASNSIEIDSQKGNKDSGLSIEDIVQECKLFYFAGQETTAVMLIWTMIMLSINLEWQARAREEVLQIFGTKIPDIDGLNRLRIMTMIFNEVLRLYPPAAELQRAISEETKLGNATLPAGVQMLLPPILIHQDPHIWGEEAMLFKPERFSEGVFNATKGQLSYFPFGWGPRICPGQNFAMLEAKTAMAMILQRFSFEISPSYVHAPCRVLTVQPQYGAHLILHKL